MSGKMQRLSNYEISKQQAQRKFLEYDQEKMVGKFSLRQDKKYIYINFVKRPYRIGRADGKAEWSDDRFAHCQEAGYNEAMTLYDVLCYSKEGCHLAGEFLDMRNLSSLQPGGSFFQKTAELFDRQGEALAAACEKLGGQKRGQGDVSYQIPLFEFLPVLVQFWHSDEEFPASLQLFADKNMLDYMHYETVWFAMSHLLDRLEEEMGCGICQKP